MFNYLFRFKKILLLAGDIFVFYASLALALVIRYGTAFPANSLKDHFVYFSFILPAALLIFYINSLYDLKKTKNQPSFYLAVFKSILLDFLIISAYFYFTPAGITPKTNLFLFLLILFALFTGWRSGYNIILQSPKLKKNTVLIGAGGQDEILAKEINTHPEYGYRLKYSINPADTDKIKETLNDGSNRIVILGSGAYASPDMIKLLYQYRHPDREFINLNEFYEKTIRKIPLFAINEIWFLEKVNEQKLLYDILKRALDLALSLAAGAVFLLLLVPLAAAIKLDNPGPVFYTQKRVGKNGKTFTLVKFRSMMRNNGQDGPLWTEKNDPRVTRVGKFMRQMRLDELPQVLNIIGGEMSFIGPRPERVEAQEEFKKQIPFYEERNLIKPGLTGWAQVKYRYATSADDSLEKLQYDLYYIKNRSLSLDMDIILKTVNIVLARQGQ